MAGLAIAVVAAVMSIDTRRRSPADQERLRRRVVALVAEGVSQAEAARRCGVSRQSVCAWIRTWREQGEGGLRSRKRGPREPRILIDGVRWRELDWWWSQQGEIGPIDVMRYVRNTWGIALSRSTARRYLKRLQDGLPVQDEPEASR